MSIEAHFSREILRLGGVGLNDPEILPGTPLERVQLETFELADDRADALSLDGGQDLVIQGTDLSRAAEEATFIIDGVPVLTEAPRYRLAFLRTNIGIISGYLFEAEGQTYFISQTRQEEVVHLDEIIETSTVRQIEEVGRMACPNFGLFPEGSQLLGNVQFNMVTTLAGTGVSITDAQVTDTDGIRDNGLETGDFVGAEEISATLRLKDGSRLSNVRGLRQVSTLSYGTTVRSHVFEESTLTGVGVTLDDIATVESITFTPHNLTYFELGFKPVLVEPLPDLGTAPYNSAPSHPPSRSPLELSRTSAPTVSPMSQDFNIVRVTADSVTTTTLRGTAGPDIFVLGAQASDGSRDRFRIRDFDVTSDYLVLEQGARVLNSRVRQNNRLVVRLQGDGDLIVMDGVSANEFVVDTDVISVPGSFEFDPNLFTRK